MNQSCAHRVLKKSSRILDGWSVQKSFVSLRGEQRLYFTSDFGIRLRQQGGAFFHGAFAGCVKELFDLEKTLQVHGSNPRSATGIGFYLLNSRNNQALAKSQSRVTVRGEISSAATIASSVKPPK